MRIPLNSDRENDERQHHQARTYRALLQAFGYPMRVHQLESEAVQAVIECLLDEVTAVALAEGGVAFRDRILATGAVFSEAPQWVFAGTRLSGLSTIPSGTREIPEDGAMVVMAIDGISENHGALCVQARSARLSEPSRLFFSGLGRGVIEDHISLHKDYPRGVDLLLCAGNRIVALPRYLRLEMV